MPEAVSNPQWAAFQNLRAEIAKAVVGQDAAVTGLLIGLLCDGHVLLEGVPGTAKTLLVRALAAALNLDNKRVQFTPDLMPGDLTGSLIYNSSSSEFTFRPGPVFTNLLLADEINRTPPKTQAALLEAMSEHRVSVDGAQRELPEPFLVVATQNPVEYEGTYALPEAQLDRFLLKMTMDLPSREVEYEVLRRHATTFDPTDLASAEITPVADAQTVLAARQQVARIAAHAEVLHYIVELVQATRQAPAVELGVSPRGAVALLYTARAWAWLSGRNFITPDDVKSLAVPTLAHRIKLRSEAELDGVKVTTAIENILQTVAVPR
ncbi:MAG: MoxR family ATPase [Trueperella sp.]|nr:MoxR family ATPase [Trueperella sp.]